MPLTKEHVGPRILAKIKIYVLTRAELLFNLCYEIPCITGDMAHKKTQALVFNHLLCTVIRLFIVICHDCKVLSTWTS